MEEAIVSTKYVFSRIYLHPTSPRNCYPFFFFFFTQIVAYEPMRIVALPKALTFFSPHKPTIVQYRILTTNDARSSNLSLFVAAEDGKRLLPIARSTNIGQKEGPI